MSAPSSAWRATTSGRSRRVARPRGGAHAGVVLGPKHWSGTKGACDVATSYFQDGLIAAADAISECGLLALLGSPGLGKTFLVKSVAGRLDMPFYYLECAPLVRGRQQTIAMLRALDCPHDPRESPATLLEALVEACATEPQVFALDEMDRWGTEGVERVRYLWSQPDNKAAFIFAGSKIGRLIAANPALDSRIEHRVTFQPLDLDETKGALRAYHRVFQVEEDALLAEIHTLTGGEFRGFAILLRSILRLTGTEPTLTSELLERAWSATGRKTWRDRK